VNIDDAKASVAAQNANLMRLEDEIARLASQHSGPVLMAIVRVLIEMACSAQGAHFRVFNKIKLYEAVLSLLSQKGIT
jgi:hypothetical protein